MRKIQSKERGILADLLVALGAPRKLTELVRFASSVTDSMAIVSASGVRVEGAPSVTPSTELTVEEYKTAHDGNRIGAIKLVRERTGLGLAESKALVDRLCP